MKLITPAELSNLLKDTSSFQLIDVREPYEFKICALPCTHIPMADIPSNINLIDRSKQIAVMCKSGKRAAAVANLLETDYQFDNVAIVDGGIIAYAELIDNSLELYE